MLHLVTGIAHSGKSRFITDAIKRHAAAGEPCILLVPEQASFVNERAVSKLLNPSVVTVVSFSRLAELLLVTLGGKKPLLDETGSHMLMCVALKEVGDHLHLFKHKQKSRGFIEQMAAFADECKNAGITPESLSVFAKALPKGSLRDKTDEAALILDAYEGLVAQSGMTQADAVTLAARRLDERGALADTHVFIDDFSGFTAPEWRMAEALIKKCAQVTVSVCCDGLNSRRPVFALTLQTASRLQNIAERSRILVKITDMPPHNNLPEGLVALESAIDGIGPTCRDGMAGVECAALDNAAEELETVAARIASLVREEKTRYRDIAVISNNPGRYNAILPIVFSAYNIPYFLDLPRDAKSCALARGLLDAVMLATGEGGEWTRYIKSPLLGFDETQAGITENYCFVWSVKPAKWLTPFRNHPDGLVERLEDEAEKRLQIIENCRKAATTPVLRLKEAFTKGTGKDIAKGVYDYLAEIRAAENLGNFAASLPPSNRALFLEEQSLLWDQIMQVLDRFALLPDDLHLGSGQIAELFELTVGAMKVSTPPRTLDETAVGTAGRMRPDSPSVVFLLGAIDGEFPAAASFSGLFSSYERRTLVQRGLNELAGEDSFEQKERMVAYRAATSASRMVMVTYPKKELTGVALLPSSMYKMAEALSKEEAPAPLNRVQTPGTLAMELARKWEENTAAAQTLRALALEYPDSQRLAAIKQAKQSKNPRIIRPKTARRLFTKRMQLSPSRLENYYKCPFMFFVKDGLRFSPLRKAELSSAEAGTMLHHVLTCIIERHGGKNLSKLSDEKMQSDIQNLIEEYIAQRTKDPDAITIRMRQNFARQGDWAFALLRRLGEEFDQSAFTPCEFELAIEQGGKVEPPVYMTPEGDEIVLRGSVDRVDVAEIKGQRYVRVVDYKSGGKEFRLSDVLCGLNMQMLLYLFAVCKHAKGSLENALPAGVLYLPVLGKYHTVDRGATQEQLDKKKDAVYRPSGLVLKDQNVCEAMENNQSSRFLPNNKNPDEVLATTAEMDKLKQLVENMVVEMAQKTLAGDIAVVPAEQNKKLSCDYCDYRALCGFEEGDPVRKIEKLGREAVFGEGSGDE